MIWSVNINVADIRAEPKFRSERISQALFNETVRVEEEKDGYSRVICGNDGYEGWIASQFISEHDGFPKDNTYRVTANLASGYAAPGTDSGRVASLPYGCYLYGEVDGDFIRLATGRYGEIFVSLSQATKYGFPEKPSLPDRDELVVEAEKFLGAPYLWGGRSFFGIDCSGFVQTVARRFGMELPRDTKDQIDAGTEIKRGQVRHGDLLFFPRHVVMAVSNSGFIHSSSTNGGVAYNSVDSNNKLFNEYYYKEFKTARRIFE